LHLYDKTPEKKLEGGKVAFCLWFQDFSPSWQGGQGRAEQFSMPVGKERETQRCMDKVQALKTHP
jgi:hypothetical protein